MDPIAVQQAVEQFADFLLKYFVALAAVGALAMALIELWKKLRDSRTRFHARAVTAWLRDADQAAVVSRFQAQPGLAIPKISGNSAFEDLLQLTTGLDRNEVRPVSLALRQAGKIEEGLLWLAPKAEYALFALELERMMGHIQEAADIALSSPQKYPSLYLFVTAGASAEDVREWAASADLPPPTKTVDRVKVKRRADLFARLQQVAKRKLDAFQLYTSYRWTNRNMRDANVVGALVMFGVLLWIRGTQKEGAMISYEAMTLLSLLGGMLSPIAKDIVVALRKVRQGV
jgi:hypothetical protein